MSKKLNKDYKKDVNIKNQSKDGDKRGVKALSAKSGVNKTNKPANPQVGNNSYNDSGSSANKQVKGNTVPGLKGCNTNDPAWYFMSSDQAKAAGSFVFSRPAGLPVAQYSKPESGAFGAIPGAHTGFTITPDYFANINIPSVMALTLLPVIGVSSNVSAAVNFAAQAMYAQIRSVVSGTRPYQPNDVMDAVLRILSIRLCYLQLVNVAGIMYNWDSMDRNMPNALLSAMTSGRVTSSVAIDKLALISKLTALGAKINSLPLPNTFPVVNRYLHLLSSIWLDKAEGYDKQMYVITMPYLYRKLNTSTAPNSRPVLCAFDMWADLVTTAGRVKYENQDALDHAINYLDTVLSDMLSDTDIGVISADILRAYGSELLVSTPVPLDYAVPFTYSEEVLQQIRNLSILPKPTYFADVSLPTDIPYILGNSNNKEHLAWYAYEKYNGDAGWHAPAIGYHANQVEDGLWQCTPQTVYLSHSDKDYDIFDDSNPIRVYVPNRNILIRSTSEAPTPEENFVSTRLTATTEVTNTDMDYFTNIGNYVPGATFKASTRALLVTSCGTECCVDITFHQYWKPYPDSEYKLQVISYTNLFESASGVSALSAAMVTMLFANFSAIPVFPASSGGAISSSMRWSYAIHDYFNWSIVDSNIIRNIQEVAILASYRSGLIK